MTRLTPTEKEQVIATVRDAARAEAMLAWEEGWRLPQKTRACKRLGRSHTYLDRHGLAEVFDTEVAAVIAQQCDAIVTEAEAMLEDWEQGRLTLKTLALTSLERRLGMRRLLLVGVAADPKHRFHEARQQCLKTWGEVKTEAKPRVKLAVKLAHPAKATQQFCRCCNTRVLDRPTINGYLPECWREKQYWDAVDEGRLNRLSA